MKKIFFAFFVMVGMSHCVVNHDEAPMKCIKCGRADVVSNMEAVTETVADSTSRRTVSRFRHRQGDCDGAARWATHDGGHDFVILAIGCLFGICLAGIVAAGRV